MYKIGSAKTAEFTLDEIRNELNNLGMGGEKKIVNIAVILQDYDSVWKPISSYFYLTLHRKWKENNKNDAFVKMYEENMTEILQNPEDFYWRVNAGEIEIKRED